MSCCKVPIYFLYYKLKAFKLIIHFHYLSKMLWAMKIITVLSAIFVVFQNNIISLVTCAEQVSEYLFAEAAGLGWIRRIPIKSLLSQNPENESTNSDSGRISPGISQTPTPGSPYHPDITSFNLAELIRDAVLYPADSACYDDEVWIRCDVLIVPVETSFSRLREGLCVLSYRTGHKK